MADRNLRDEADKLTRELIDRGKIIEAGWVSLRVIGIDRDAGPVQLASMRMAFFAGAQHLFGSIMSALDGGTEASQADMSRMQNISDELDAFGEELNRAIETKGNA